MTLNNFCRKFICRLVTCLVAVIIATFYTSALLRTSPVVLPKLNSITNLVRSPSISATFDNTRAKLLIILAYMHTGSTYVGSLIQQHPGTYYEFESLRSLQSATRNGRQIKYINETFRRPPPPSDGNKVNTELAVSSVHNMLTCNHSRLDIGTLTNFYFGINNEVNRDLRPYINCVAKGRKSIYGPHSPSIPLTSVTDAEVSNCVPLIAEKCKPANIRVMKFIRLTMAAALSLLEKLDNVRIIHLVRDPRAMLDSQLRKNDEGVKNFRVFQERTKYMCKCIREDLMLAEKIKANHRGLLYSLRYEDMVDNPIGIAKDIFEFIEEDFTESDEMFVKRRSIDSSKNSSVRAAVWRQHLPYEHLKVVNEHCDDLYDELGYVKFNTIKEVRNSNLKSHKSRWRLW